jgi:hypothetical protein
MPSDSLSVPLSRREAIHRILLASALAASLDISAFGAEDIRLIGEDPDLLKKEIPWPRVLTEQERRTVEALADVIVPADESGPAASAVGVTDFIDEWVSAPYEQQKRDLAVIRPGLAWLDEESRRRFSAAYAAAAAEQKTALLEEIIKPGTDANRAALKFYRLFRDRVAGAYYSTPVGWKALGYVGNIASAEFAGPPAEILQKLGLA